MSDYVFGPVPSRRLGFSLGVDVIPAKYCCFDCVYCQIGKTLNNELVRRSFFDPHKVVDEIIQRVSAGSTMDYITFSGSGEPTLNADLGLMIDAVKSACSIPVAVITNGALLYQNGVRRDLMGADCVLPSLDAVSEDIFRYINRPHSLLEVETIIRGLKLFRKEYKGQIWLEIMLIKDVNDEMDELSRLKEVISDIGVDKVQLNTVTRPPNSEVTGQLTATEMKEIASFLGPGCEVITSFDKSVSETVDGDWVANVLEVLKRRSLTIEDVVGVTGLPFYTVKNRLAGLEAEGVIKSYFFHDSIFYMIS